MSKGVTTVFHRARVRSVRHLVAALGPRGARLRRWASLIDGLAHAERLRILGALLDGPRSHAELRKALRLKAGPLYFHLRVLEREGLIEREHPRGYATSHLGLTMLWCCACIAEGHATGRAGR